MLTCFLSVTVGTESCIKWGGRRQPRRGGRDGKHHTGKGGLIKATGDMGPKHNIL